MRVQVTIDELTKLSLEDLTKLLANLNSAQTQEVLPAPQSNTPSYTSRLFSFFYGNESHKSKEAEEIIAKSNIPG